MKLSWFCFGGGAEVNIFGMETKTCGEGGGVRGGVGVRHKSICVLACEAGV